jgi:hypothetical protein
LIDPDLTDEELELIRWSDTDAITFDDLSNEAFANLVELRRRREFIENVLPRAERGSRYLKKDERVQPPSYSVDWLDESGPS